MDDFKTRFHRNPEVNPRTGRKIKIHGPTYKLLVEDYGDPENVLPEEYTKIVINKSLFDQTTYVKTIGSGTYGTVEKHYLSDGSIVAIKKFRNSDEGIESSTLREIHCLQLMKGSPQILRLLEIDIHLDNGITKSKIMISYHTSDLKKFSEVVNISERIIYAEHIIDQLLNGLYQLYIRGIIHRDIKPANILVEYDYDRKTNKLKSIPKCYIADFGISRQLACNVLHRKTDILDRKQSKISSFDRLRSKDNMTLEVYTSIYRPPEILASNSSYTEKADIWAMGITIMEYFIATTLIKIGSELDIIKDILKNLAFPMVPSSKNIEKFKNEKIHDSLNIKSMLTNHMSLYHYDMIPNEIILLLISMLSVNTKERPDITILAANKEIFPQTEIGLSRGNIYKESDVTSDIYYVVVDWLLQVFKMFKLKVRTGISAIDLFDRYVSNYPLKRSEIHLFAVACLMIAAKMIEIYSPEINDYAYVSDDAFTVLKLKETELIIVKNMNYLLISCDIDNYVNIIENEYADPFKTILPKIYKSMKKDNVYPGNLLYEKIIYYVKKENITL